MSIGIGTFEPLLKYAAGAAAVGVAAAVSQHVVKQGFVKGYELPRSELVARVDGMIVERKRPQYTTAVQNVALAVGAASFIAGGLFRARIVGLPVPPTNPLAMIGAFALMGLGLGVITGAVGAASLFSGATVRTYPAVADSGVATDPAVETQPTVTTLPTVTAPPTEPPPSTEGS